MERYYRAFGWKDWKVFDHVPPMHHNTELRGEQVHYSLRGAEVMVGSLNFELLEPLEGPSLWKEFMAERGEGIASIAVMFDTIEESRDRQARVRQARHRGHDAGQHRRPHRVLLSRHPGALRLPDRVGKRPRDRLRQARLRLPDRRAPQGPRRRARERDHADLGRRARPRRQDARATTRPSAGARGRSSSPTAR